MKSSLNIDLFFAEALKRSEKLREMCGNRIFHTYRNSTAENDDKIPYLILTADEVRAGMTTKDVGVSEFDTAICSVLCVAGDMKNGNTKLSAANVLAELTSAVVEAVESAYDDHIWDEYEDWNFRPYKIIPNAMSVEPDTDKPCLFRWIEFTCEI